MCICSNILAKIILLHIFNHVLLAWQIIPSLILVAGLPTRVLYVTSSVTISTQISMASYNFNTMSADISSSDEEDINVNISREIVKPYQFEPLRTTSNQKPAERDDPSDSEEFETETEATEAGPATQQDVSTW